MKKLSHDIHCFFSNVLGVLLLLYAGISYVVLFCMYPIHIGTIRTMLQLPNMFFLGLLLIGASQFLRYISGQTDRLGWVLRKGEFIIYLAIIIKIAQVIWSLSTVGGICFGSSCSLSSVTQKPIVETALSAIMVFVRILIMFGVAQSLRAMRYSSSKKLVDGD